VHEQRANQVLVIDKAVRLLDEFRTADTLSLSELSERLRMSKSTVHRLLNSLEQVGFVEKEAQPGSYRLGMKLFELGSLVQGRMHLRQIALHYMIELVERTGETAFLMIRDGLHGLCIERVEGQNVQSLALKLGGTLPLHVGAGPRVLLAFAPTEVQEQYLEQESLRIFTPKTIHSSEALRGDIAGIQGTGYALSYEDVTIGVAALGVPLFNHKSEVVGALSLSGITPRWTKSHIAEVLAELRSVGVQISSRMGWRSDRTGGREQSALPASEKVESRARA
jgi:DNA-binding IclR family transcriptional regulator